MLLSAASVLVVAPSSSEIPEGLMNDPVQSTLSYDIWVYENTSYEFCVFVSYRCTLLITLRQNINGWIIKCIF